MQLTNKRNSQAAKQSFTKPLVEHLHMDCSAPLWPVAAASNLWQVQLYTTYDMHRRCAGSLTHHTTKHTPCGKLTTPQSTHNALLAASLNTPQSIHPA
jgi:hypothetical protein